MEQREVDQGGTHQLGIISFYSQSIIVKGKVAATNQGLNTTTPTEVVVQSLAVIYMMTLIATDSPISERDKDLVKGYYLIIAF